MLFVSNIHKVHFLVKRIIKPFVKHCFLRENDRSNKQQNSLESFIEKMQKVKQTTKHLNINDLLFFYKKNGIIFCIFIKKYILLSAVFCLIPPTCNRQNS